VLPGSGSVSAIAVGDLDGNGDVSLIVGTRNRQLWVLNNNGTGRGGWPRSVPAVIEAQPVVANLDGTGPKIIVATGSTLDPAGVGSVTVFNPDGTQRWQRLTVDGSGIFSSPAVVDLDGDGLLEIIVGAFDQRASTSSVPTGRTSPAGPGSSRTPCGPPRRWPTSTGTAGSRSSSAPTPIWR
jgi:FG-GAP repeat